MKVLFVDINTAGHHMIYFKSIMSLNFFEKVLVLPKINSSVTIKQYEIPSLSRNMTLSQYVRMLVSLRKIVKLEHPDIVHFLTGDMLYRFFGVGLSYLKCNIITTFHHVELSFLKKISYRFIFAKIKYGVVHTKYIFDNLQNINICNATHIEYPFLEKFDSYNRESLRTEFNIADNIKILLAFGDTRYDKGLDILLKSLNNVKIPFHLIIAGKPSYFSGKQIEELTAAYTDKVSCFLYFISDELMNKLFSVADIVVLPYRKIFSGASGPLTAGVSLEKIIIGPDYNSLGALIKDNHLGYVFTPECIDSLKIAIESAVENDFDCDSFYKEYKNRISPKCFIKSYEHLYLTCKNY